jgi:hypothetical protein
MVLLSAFTRPFRTSSPKPPTTDVVPPPHIQVDDAEKNNESGTLIVKEDPDVEADSQNDQAGTMGSTGEGRRSSERNEAGALTPPRRSTDGKKTPTVFPSIGKVGKRDRRRSTDIIESEPEGDAAVKDADGVIDQTDGAPVSRC